MNKALPAGEYYVGDLCYIGFSNEFWLELCDASFDTKNRADEGYPITVQGIKLVMMGTAWGDGIYDDNFGREFPVDSGTIGCVSVADIQKIIPDWTPEAIREVDGIKLGRIDEYRSSFDCDSNGGELRFGDLVIETEPEYDECDEEDYNICDDGDQAYFIHSNESLDTILTAIALTEDWTLIDRKTKIENLCLQRGVEPDCTQQWQDIYKQIEETK